MAKDRVFRSYRRKRSIKAKTGKDADKISELPDAILVGILSLLSTKQAARAAILSRRWREVFAQYISTRRELDFVGDFRQRQSPEEFVDRVNHYLELNVVCKVDRFRVSVDLPESCSADLERWMTFAAAKGVEDLALDFTQDGEVEDVPWDTEYIFNRPKRKNKFVLRSCALAATTSSLRSINLTRCNLSHDFDFAHLGSSLRHASFKNLKIKNNVLNSILPLCPTLESLCLWDCRGIATLKCRVADGHVSTRLKELVIVNCRGLLVHLSAPRLCSFKFHGELGPMPVLMDITDLEDALFNFRAVWGEEPIEALQMVTCAKTLTLSHYMLMYIDMAISEVDDDYLDVFPIALDNLKELQLLLYHGIFIDQICNFFLFCPAPLLEQIFIRLPATLIEENNDRGIEVDHGVNILENLKTVKIDNCYGTKWELKLALFFLEFAPVLEKLVLVAARSPSPNAPNWHIVGKAVAFFAAEALSHKVELIFCEHSDDTSGLNPTHTDITDEEPVYTLDEYEYEEY